MKFIKLIYYVFLGFLALIAVLLAVSVLPITGNFKVLTVLSGSMEPSIKTGSIVAVKPSSDYKIGDVITFGVSSKTQKPTTHRIYDIKVENGQPVYITKGDANNGLDLKEITNKDIIGKVLFSVPYIGYAVETARKPLGFAFIIIVPAAAVIIDEIRKIYLEIKKRKNPAE